MPPLNEEQVQHCIEILNRLSASGSELSVLPETLRIELFKAAGKLSHPDPELRKQRRKDRTQTKIQQTREQERKARALTGIRKAREESIFTAPLMLSESETQNYSELSSPRNCYVCKEEFTRLHFFYDAMCPRCAEFNYKKRFQTADLSGQVALITGSRLKIGYQATLMMLKAGAEVIATTRFPADSALRFSKEPDFQTWKHRLHIYGLDLRHTPSVEIFCRHIEQSFHRLDLLINNAAQTVRRPPGFYAHLMENELKSIHDFSSDVRLLLTRYQDCLSHLGHENPDPSLPVSWHARQPGVGLSAPAKLSQIPYAYDEAENSHAVFPQGKLDADLQQIDLRENNSWRLTLGEIPTAEMLELHLVNAVAPFVLCNRLIPLMKKDFTGKKHIVNVSAMEGKFLKFKKGERHPHTNMAKAALNMLTHTSASGLAPFGIYMNAVDTGWVTDEDPAKLAQKKQELHDFQPPLDIVDGAARVCDPFFDGILTGKHWCGQFLKDYFPIDW